MLIIDVEIVMRRTTKRLCAVTALNAIAAVYQTHVHLQLLVSEEILFAIHILVAEMQQFFVLQEKVKSHVVKGGPGATVFR